MPSSSHTPRKRTTSRSTSFTSSRSRTTRFGLPSISDLNSCKYCDSIRPLSRSTVSRPSERLLMCKVIFGRGSACATELPAQLADSTSIRANPPGETSSIAEISAGSALGRTTWRPEPVLVDAQALNLRLQRRSRNPELDGGAGWAGNPPLALLERGFDHFPFAIDERCHQRNGRLGGFGGFSLQPYFVDGEG